MFRDRYGEEAAHDLHLLVVLERAVRSVEHRLFAHIRSGYLTPGQFDVLEALYHNGPLTVNEVIAKTLGSSGNIGFVIDNLIESGLVEKRVDECDRRVRHVALSEAGRRRMAEFFPEHVQVVRSTFASLDREEKQILIDLLRKLGKGVG